MYKSYPKYKSSNVFWMGDIPSHWEIKKVKHVASFYTGWTPPSGSEEYYDGEYPWANISDLGIKYLEAPARTITKEAVDSLRMKLSYKGSMLFSFKLSIGLVSLLLNDTYTNEAIATFPPNQKINTSYLYYLSQVAIPMNAGVNIYNAPMLNQESIKNAFLVYPPIDEQQAIASFLDRETARIDALIRKKERMIELLKEKRIALITQAVTKGLDPNVPMKDSGNEWLGEVPEHWEVKRIKYIAIRIQTGCTPLTINEQYYEDGTINWFGPGSFSDDLYLTDPVKIINETSVMDGAARLFEKGSIMIVGIGATIGKIAQIKTPASCNQQITVVTLRNSEYNADYYTYLLKTMENTIRGIAPSATLAIFDQGKIASLSILDPPIQEQVLIAEFLSKKISDLSIMMTRIDNSITLLREYRASLIHHAVTGKIDLREYANEHSS